MAEYLDKSELISRIKKAYCTGCRNYSGTLCRACDIGETLEVIDDMPTIELKDSACAVDEDIRHG